MHYQFLDIQVSDGIARLWINRPEKLNALREDVQKMWKRANVTGPDDKKTRSTREAAEKDETCAPVAQWSTIRLLLALTCICKLQTSQTDFGNAFAQAALPEPIHMSLPRDFHVDTSVKQHPDQEMCLKLRKNLRGSVDAP